MTVKLRYPELRDAEWMLKEETSEDARNNSDYETDYTLADIKNFIDLNRTGADPTQVRLIVEVEGEKAGMVDLTGISKRNGHADIGLYVNERYRGKGVGTDTLREAVQIAALMGLSHLKVLIAANNISSRKVFEKVGFEKVGEIPGWLNNGKENAIIYHLDIMGDNLRETFDEDAALAAKDEFSLYGLEDGDLYDSPFGELRDDLGDDEEFGGFESIDDYIDKI